MHGVRQPVDDELVVEPQVHRRRLDLQLRVVEGIDDDLAPVETGAKATVGENHSRMIAVWLAVAMAMTVDGRGRGSQNRYSW